MNMEKIAGLIFLILGLLFIIYPLFSSAFLSILIGFALVCFGMSEMTMGFLMDENNAFSYLSMLVGIISIIFGMIFMFFLNAVPFLVSLQFYIVGFLMIVYGFLGIFFQADKKYKIISIIILLLGILTVAFAVFLASQPVLIAILVGVSLIVEGVFLLVIGNSISLIESNG